MSSENVTSRFCNRFSITQSHCAWKMCSNWINLSSYAHVVHTSTKQVISRRRKNKNVFKMSKDEICTCKACINPNTMGFQAQSLWVRVYKSNWIKSRLTFWSEGKTGVPNEKPLRAEKRTKKFNPPLTDDESGNRTQATLVGGESSHHYASSALTVDHCQICKFVGF